MPKKQKKLEHDTSAGMPLVSHCHDGVERCRSFSNGGNLLDKSPRMNPVWELQEDVIGEMSVAERLRHISQQLSSLNQKLESRVEDSNNRDIIQKEWRAVAAVLDKIFMVFFATIAVVVYAQGFAVSI